MKSALRIGLALAVVIPASAATLSRHWAAHAVRAAAAEPQIAMQRALVPRPLRFNGAAFGPDGRLYVGSVQEQEIVAFEWPQGGATVEVGAPEGEADDLAFAADGTLVWTSIKAGVVRARRPGKKPEEWARIGWCDPIAIDGRGRIFVGQSYGGKGLYEVYEDGRKPTHILDVAGLNAFAFGPDGALYSPDQSAGSVVRIDVDSRVVTTVLPRLSSPMAAKFDAAGSVWVLEGTGLLGRWEEAGARLLAAVQLPVRNDNFAVASNGDMAVVNERYVVVVRDGHIAGRRQYPAEAPRSGARE
jgi:sugar lactone lactonase YvrE